MKSWFACITAALFFFGCAHSKTPDISYPTTFSFEDGANKILVLLESIDADINRIVVLTTYNNKIVNARAAILPWPIYQFQRGDIDDDDIADLFVGVIKACPYDPVVRRRLFVYEVIDGDLRAKWLGTHVSYHLKDFRTIAIDNKTYIRTIEQDESGIYHIVTYAWAAFGPRLINNQEGGNNHEDAYRIYNSDSSFNVASTDRISKKGSLRGERN